MSEYLKKSLENVSVNPKLFEKELNKAFNTIKRSESDELKKWVEMTFKNTYPKILSRVL